MAKKGLRAWVGENWVDIANKKSDGSYPKCGRSGGEKRKNYPKCVPAAKASGMSRGQKALLVLKIYFLAIRTQTLSTLGLLECSKMKKKK